MTISVGQRVRIARQRDRNFAPPRDLDAAELKRLELAGAIQDIDAQLGSERAMVDAPWRQSAIYARQKLLEKIRALNDWMKAQRRHAHALTTGAGGVHSDPNVAMLSRAYRLLKTWASEIDDIDPGEQSEIDAIMAHLQRCVDPEVMP